MTGGFHVSGCLALLPEMPADLKRALDMGVSLFAGELEGRTNRILRDAANGTLQPVYNYLKDLPSLESEPTPILPAEHLRKTFQALASFDAGRGCPFQCSFCTIINVQGRKSRHRSADDVVRTIREHYAQGIRHFFITDDNLARNKDWEAIFDRIIALREGENMNIRLMVQVDTLCHKIPNFIEKAARAGTNRVLVGLESINAANLLAAKKRQNKITEYRTMLLAWKNAGVITTAGYILGFPFDTPESIREDIAIIRKELPLDILEFFCLTPLPGSEDHKVLWQKGEWMHEDMNLYDGEHAVSHHPKMSKEEWEQVYRSAWQTYYTPEHMETILRRGAAARCSMSRLVSFVILVQLVRPNRERPPAAGWAAAPQISAGPSSGDADRIDMVVLSEICLGLYGEIFPCAAAIVLASCHQQTAAEGSEAVHVHRSGDDSGDRRRDREARLVHTQRCRSPGRRACAQDQAAHRHLQNGERRRRNQTCLGEDHAIRQQ
jgi:Radical SAM superfamily